MTVHRVGLATSSAFPDLAADDRLLLDALCDRGVDARPVVWSDGSVEWGSYDRVVVRSCWDYHRDVGAFRSWMRAVDARDVEVWNPPTLCSWNVDKSYLVDLRAAGVPTVPTRIVERSSPRPLRAVLDEEGWSEAVVKPSVAATAYRTYRVADDAADVAQSRLERVLDHADALVQPFVPEIETAGERSLVYVDGEFTHAVRKHASDGDYRVQAEFGGRVEAATAPARFVGVGDRALAAVPGAPTYARVDGVETGAGFRVMEVELVDPELFFGHSATATERFADLVAGR